MANKNFYVSLDLFQNQLLKAVIENASIQMPTSPVRGQLVFWAGVTNPPYTKDRMYYWNGNNWQDMTGLVQSLVPGSNKISISNNNGIYTLDVVPANINHADLGGITALNNPHVVTIAHAIAAGDDAGGATITNLPLPQNDSEVATKAYVDNLQTGLNWHDPVDVATTAAIDITNVNPGTTTIDGQIINAGNRVLVKDQGASSTYSTFDTNNGIYIVPAVAGPLTRATDANNAAELTNATVLVLTGTNNAGDVYSQSETLTDPLGGDPIHFAPISTGVNITAGTGMKDNGNVFDVQTVKGTGITVNADDIAVFAADIAADNQGLTVGTEAWRLVVSIDDDTVGINGSGQLYLKNGSVETIHIDETETLSFGLWKNTSDSNKIDVKPYGNNSVNGFIVPVTVSSGTTPDQGVGIPIDNTSIQLNSDNRLSVNPKAGGLVNKSEGTINLTGTGLAFEFAHNLNVDFVTVAIYQSAGGTLFDLVETHIQIKDKNTINIFSNVAVSNAKIVVIG